MGLNLALLLEQSAKRAGDNPALRLGQECYSYAELDELSRRFAAMLRARGFEPGTSVGLILPNGPAFPVAYFGTLRAGGSIVPMNVMLRPREIAYYLKDSGARFLVTDPDCADAAAEGAAEAGVEDVIVAGADREALVGLLADHRPDGNLAQTDPGDPAVLLYTSGTTGRPKGATLTHSGLLWNAQVSAELFELTSSDRLLGTLPLFHSFGQTCVMNAALRRAAEVILIPRFEPAAALSLIADQRVTVFVGVPTMYVGLLSVARNEERDLSALRLCVSGGAAIALEVLRGFEAEFGCRVLEGYGLSETSPVASFNHLDRPSKPGSIGTAIWGTEMRVVGEDGAERPSGEVGEVLIRGHNVMSGYHGRPEDTAEAISADGWLHTGDLARMDDDGYFFIVDRKKDLVIRGGYNVYPREIEEVLYEHPAVLEAAVLGIPDEDLGEEIVAAVAARPGEQIDPDQLREWTRERVAPYKYPRRIAVVAELPKGPTGKILKRELPPGLFAAPAA